MSEIRTSSRPGRAARRWRRASAAVMPSFVATLATADARGSTSIGEAPAAPQPISTLTPRGNLGRDEHLISPTPGAQQ
jgi:hypothetical protein